MGSIPPVAKVPPFGRERGSDWGCARIVRWGEQVELEYLDLPGQPRERRLVDRGAVVLDEPSEEARVWLKTQPYGWLAGRWQAQVGDEARIKVGGSKAPVSVPIDIVEVRWDRELDACDEAVAIGLCDSPAFYAARMPLVANLIAQRRACRGFTAVLSAAVRPFQHQVNVLARVMGDPVLRYVLADEVGLGKTVEAGLVIRQLLLDHPGASVHISVPPPLLGQWRAELRDKLLLGAHLDAGDIVVAPHDDLSLAAIRSPDLLVVDEAHRLAADGFDSVDYELARAAAARTQRLLLLTATPLRGNAATFLGLLHLVDSVAYPLDDLPSFEQRLHQREQLATDIEVLDPLVPRAFVEPVLDRLASHHPDDKLLQRELQSVRVALDCDASDELGMSFGRLVTHLRETYRLSRRVIRNRRSDVITTGFRVAGRRFTFEPIDDPARSVLDGFLEDWRLLLVEAGDSPEVQNLFRSGVERAMAGSTAARRFLTDRLEATDDSSQVGFVGTEERVLFQQVLAQLDLLDTRPDLDWLREWAVTWRSKGSGRLVVMTSYPEVAEEVGHCLGSVVGQHALRFHLEGTSPDEQDAAVQALLAEGGLQVLVCDRSGEEGRNFQAVTEVVHLDIPLSVNRFEQRIGRVDRYTEPGTKPASSVVLSRTGSIWTGGFEALLRDGVGVFEDSVATLQGPLADLDNELTSSLLSAGAEAFGASSEGLRERLDEERRAVDLLEELESTSANSHFGPSDLLALEDFEEDWGDVRDAFALLTEASGGVRLRTRPDDRIPGAFSYGVDPHMKRVPLMSARHFRRFAAILGSKFTFSRAIAMRYPGTRLVRLGDPLVDELDRYLRIDERGRSRVQLVDLPRGGGTHLYHCFDFRIEFDATDLEFGDPARLRRRGDIHLPPRHIRLWTDGSDLLPEKLVSAAEAMLPGASTVRTERWARVLEAFPDFDVRARAAGAAARQTVRDDTELAASVEAAVASVERDAAGRLAILELRRNRFAGSPEGIAAAAEHQREEALTAWILASVREPRISMVAAAAIVMLEQCEDG